ncbi:MAG: biotin--[acetyl-CoA-carboxylase] ligase [Planctomycetota bacterium]|jgi:BirA family biotin operon repressor/biotin-[acetyl-CoA-carboxylase] ligase
MAPVPIEEWTDRLQGVVDGLGGPWRRVTLLRETGSTQDAARRMSAGPGDVIVAWRQTAGRGRLGRAWADTADAGIAVTMVTRAGPPQRLAVASAVGAAHAAERWLGRTAGIKWPNDIVVEGRKLAGVLIEQAAARALIGIGVNVRQTDWPSELAGRAVSLAELGVVVDRVDAVASVIECVAVALELGGEELCDAYTIRDVLKGSRSTFRTDQRKVTGTVLRIDPMRGLLLSTEGGEVYLPAATTTVVSDEG